MSESTDIIPRVDQKKRKRREHARRQWVDACINNASPIDALTIQERATVLHSLSYTLASVSSYAATESLAEDRQKKRTKTTLDTTHTNSTQMASVIQRLTLNLNTSSIKDRALLQGEGRGADKIDMCYDLVSVRPTTEKTFQEACSTLDVDIISLDMSAASTSAMVTRRQLIQQAVERGVGFEIMYTEFLHPGNRLQCISNAKTLVHATRGKNIVCSSGCSSVYDLRGPYDVANMLMVFLGMGEEQAYDCLSRTPMRLIERRRQSHIRARRNVLVGAQKDEAPRAAAPLQSHVTERLFDIS